MVQPTSRKKIEHLFSFAVKQGASDVHLLAGKPPVVRVDGELYEAEGEKELSPDAVKELVYSILTDEQRSRFEKEWELDFSYSVPEARLRVNCHFERGNAGLSARIIPPEVPSMEEVDMPEVVYHLVKRRQGFILVTGPTGCGKSTSLAAMIRQINEERSAHIITLEDPIEYLHSPVKSIIRQRQYGTDFHSFANALKHVVRQDPDIILVGEMRDIETIAAALTLAETGHLVLATLHTNSASQTIERIIDVFPPHQQDQVRIQLSLSLLAVISQRLLPRKEKGRVAAREVLINTPAVGNMIRENKIAQIKTAIQTGKEEGMMALAQDVKRLHERGIIDSDIASSYMAEKRGIFK